MAKPIRSGPVEMGKKGLIQLITSASNEFDEEVLELMGEADLNHLIVSLEREGILDKEISLTPIVDREKYEGLNPGIHNSMPHRRDASKWRWRS